MLAIIVSILALAMSHRAGAGGYEWGGLGSRAQSMGGAFIGLADDWTAIYWNPAGLTQLRGFGAGFDFSSPHITMEDGDSIANLPVAEMDTRYQRDVFAQYAPEMEPRALTFSAMSEMIILNVPFSACSEIASIASLNTTPLSSITDSCVVNNMSSACFTFALFKPGIALASSCDQS